MSTTGATHTAVAARSRHLRLVTDRPASRGAAPRVGAPQRLAAAVAGLATGFALGAVATILGGGDGSGLGAAALACVGVLIPALVACRHHVLARTRVHRSASTPAREPGRRPAVAPLRVVHGVVPDAPAASPLRRAA